MIRTMVPPPSYCYGNQALRLCPAGKVETIC